MTKLAATDSDEPIALEKISSNVLRKIIVWCEHHKDERIPTTDTENQDFGREVTLDDWDRNFLNVDQATLFDIIVVFRIINRRQIS